MRKFRKRSDKDMVIVPGVGPVRDDRVFEGDQYAKFCPSVLEEVVSEGPDTDRFVQPSDVVATRAPAPAPAPASEPPPPPPSAPEVPSEAWSDDADEEAEEVEEEEVPDMSWRKKELIDYAEQLGLDVSGMTKAEILEAIAEE